MTWRVGVDAGGTFTDVCFFNEETGELEVAKVSSTPSDPSRAVIAGVRDVLASGAPDKVVTYFAHGSTVATNALIQKRGVETGLITTEGFRDLLELGRQKRPHLYDLQTDKPVPLVTRDRRIEVKERLLHDGTVVSEIDEEEVRAAVRKLRDQGVRSIAICFLYSFVNGDHERLVERIVQEEYPEAFVTSSYQVMPEFREYERLSTVVVNAYLGPVMASYLDRLAPDLKDAGIPVHPHINQSNGGVISFETAASMPVRTVLSGPSSGIVGATYVSGLSGHGDLITFDMGGTSTDVSLIRDGRPGLASEADVEGYPVKTPMLDIRAVGAGGGSIAWIDSGGHLKVGPQSAGAVPGPVCYGLGNEEPTVTDANVVLQTLNPTHLLGGRMPIDAAASAAAIDRLAERLGLDRMPTAQGIIRVVIANMARAIRVISVQRGYDPRDFTLVAFGGAGPLHASRLAKELEIPRVLVPEVPGLLCALGLLVADLRTDYSMTRLLDANESAIADLEEVLGDLAVRADTWFGLEEIPEHRRMLRFAVDMRYRGQNYELPVDIPAGPVTASLIRELR
ncbi:MAG TPA: hydantoinase/oxoprolinase family protein, partial [Thermomicrobiales bacterium]|nr:hydantoinase/oxoprolinase family protein [Thermomicrobiales bacterium]